MKKVLRSVFHSVLYVGLLLMLIFGSTPAYSKHLYHEQDYQNYFCTEVVEGETEKYLEDNSGRIDCLTDQYAIEVDFASKWAEAIGQALYYS